MKIKSTPVFWTTFFLISLGVLALIAYSYIEPREIVVNDSQAKIIGLKIASNEDTTHGTNLIAWPSGDNLSSLGIAHFIWYPQGENGSKISFNDFLAHMSQSHVLPGWLVETQYPPWNSREDYFSKKHEAFKARMSHFLQENIDAQIQYLIWKLEAVLPKMIKEVKNPFAKMHVYENFYHVAMQKNGVYALLDYVVFMGDGISPDERYNNQGWGLLQVLEKMNAKSDDLMQAFVASADQLLTRRILNAPVNEEFWLLEWRKRLQTYSVNDVNNPSNVR